MKHPASPLERALQSRVRLLATTMRPATVRGYEHTVRRFTVYLRGAFPAVRRLSDIRRDPHILGWLEHLWNYRNPASGKPLRNSSRAAHLIQIRKLFDLLSGHSSPPLPGLLLSEDIPRPDQTLPRPLSPEDDVRLQAELRSRNDLLSHALLLTRLTGLRIGETANLATDCLRHSGGDDWAVHVPVGKLHTERWVPADGEVCAVAMRLKFLATLPPAAAVAGFLLPRPKGQAALCTELRSALHKAAVAAGISAHVVPHQLRHTYATTMLRAGVSLPALMKLLGHRSANMTLRYVEVTQEDLRREMRAACQRPRHLLPLPASALPPDPDRADADSVVQRLSASLRVLDLFRLHNPSSQDPDIRLLLRRLARILNSFKKLISDATA